MSSLKYYAVTGYGFFPVSMLGWDNCEPANQRERDRMLELCSPYIYGNHFSEEPSLWSEFERMVRDAGRDPHTICLMSDRKGGPDIARWNAFGWIVTEVIYAGDGSMTANLNETWRE